MNGQPIDWIEAIQSIIGAVYVSNRFSATHIVRLIWLSINNYRMKVPGTSF